MNDRIKELAERAGTTHKQNLGVYQFYNHELEKFAELIINDCIDLVKPTSHHLAFAQGYMGGVDGLELLYGKVDQIKNRFGIEE